MSEVFKSGRQSKEDPLEFILSDETVDRVGDVIRASGWELEQFKSNPIALLGHDHTNILGVWEDVRIEGKRLIGKLRLAKPGTSPLIDTVRSLIEQRILKATSVGFQALEANPRKGGGYEFIKQALHEVSLVAVPANPSAVALAKHLAPDIVDILFAKPGTTVDKSDSGQSTSTFDTPNLAAARERLKALGIDH